MPIELIRAVFDCNIFWQIFFSKRGIAAKCWEAVRTGTVELIVSSAVLDEVRDVLTRPETQARFPQATDAAVEIFLDEILENATFVNPVEKLFDYPRDPKDEAYINLAAATEADYIVSRDNDLLDLMTGYDAAGKEFRQRFRPLKIIDTKTLFDLIEHSAVEKSND